MNHYYRLPLERHEELKYSYDLGNWFFLISIWNQYEVTDTKICAGCPSSFEIVEKGFAQWFEMVEQNEEHEQTQ
jgi:hypothetical protein